MPILSSRLPVYLRNSLLLRCIGASVSVLLIAFQCGPVMAFDFEEVAAQAASLAKQPYRNASRKSPLELQALNYDQFRDIRFRLDHAVWRAEKLPFELMFFHLGGEFQVLPVRINEVTPAGARHIPYKSSYFDYGKNSCHRASGATLGSLAFARTTR